MIQERQRNYLKVGNNNEMKNLGQQPLASDRTAIEKISEFNDPQRALGAGISSYHQQLVHFFFLFLALFVLHIPVMALYCSYEFYDGALTTLTLGNMGFSEPVCTIEALQNSNTKDENAS